MTPSEEVTLALLESAERACRRGMEDCDMARHLIRFACNTLVEPDIVESCMHGVDDMDEDVAQWIKEGRFGG